MVHYYSYNKQDNVVLINSILWNNYPESIIAENRYHWIETSSENNWHPTAESIENIILKNNLIKYIYMKINKNI